jgi:hypothetical protein
MAQPPATIKPMHNEQPGSSREEAGPPALSENDPRPPAEAVPPSGQAGRALVPARPLEVLAPPPMAPPVLLPEAQMLGERRFPHGLSKTRLMLAFAVAGASDLVSVFTQAAPPVEWGVDLLTALVLFLILGFRWLLLPGLIMEAIPGVGVVPFWVLVVGAVAVYGRARPQLN